MAGTSLDRIDSAAAIPVIVAQEMLKALSRYSSMVPLISRDYDDQIASYGDSVKILEAGAVTIQDKAAETPITWATASPVNYTVTLDKHKVAVVKIEDVIKALSRPNLLQGYGEKAAIAIAEQVDNDLLVLATDAAVTQTVGTAGTAATRNILIDAGVKLDQAKAPRMDRHIIFTPQAAGDLMKDSAVNPFNNQFAQTTSADLPNLFGFAPHVNQGVTVTAGTPNRNNNLAFQKNGLVLATRPLAAPPSGMGVTATTVNLGGLIVRVISSYDHANFAMQITMDILYGVKVLRPDHVVRVQS